jgi:hypothetical protein
MGLLIDTLSKNKEIFNVNTASEGSAYGIWDLTRASVSYLQNNMEIDTLYIVTEYYQMRPDIIASMKYGDAGKMGSLLKFNNISNPFAINTGTFLLVPALKSIEDTFNLKKLINQESGTSNTNTNPNEVFKKNQEQKKFKVSEGRKNFLDAKVKNQPSLIISPNITQPNAKSIEKKNGYLIFAPDAGGGGANLPVN